MFLSPKIIYTSNREGARPGVKPENIVVSGGYEEDSMERSSRIAFVAHARLIQ